MAKMLKMRNRKYNRYSEKNILNISSLLMCLKKLNIETDIGRLS